MKRSLVRWLALVLLISVAFVAGCSKDAGSTSGEVKLVWWSHDNPAFVAANEQLIEEYKKVNPNVTIELQAFPYDAFIQKLKAAFAANTPPDIAQMFGTWVTDYAKKGMLQPALDDSIRQNFFDAAVGAYIVDDTLYGLPHEFNLENGGMLAHPKMFEEAGLSYPPKTWDELVDAAKALTKYDGNQIAVRGFDFTSGDNITFTFLSLILQQGGSYWTEDGRVDFSTPEAVAAMTTLKSFITDLKVTDMSLFGTGDISDTFFKGGAAMTYRGPWTIAAGIDTFKVDDFEYIPVPSFTSEPPYFAAESGWGEVVAKDSKHAEEAWKFVDFMMQKEQAMNWNIRTFSVPANEEAANDPSFVEAIPLMKTSLDVLQYGRWIGPVQDRDFFFKQINDNFGAMVAGSVSVEDGLKKIETDINAMIEQRLQQ